MLENKEKKREKNSIREKRKKKRKKRSNRLGRKKLPSGENCRPKVKPRIRSKLRRATFNPR